MSEYKPSEVKIEEKPQGTVSFATDVIATIAGLAATEVEGVASMNSTSTGISDMFSRKATKNFTKGVHIELVDDQVEVSITIVVDFGYPIPEVTRGIQENVKKALETMTGLGVRSINIHVSGISFEKEKQAARELDEQQKKMLTPDPEPEKTSAAAASDVVEPVEPEADADEDAIDTEKEIEEDAEETIEETIEDEEDDDVSEDEPEVEYVEIEYDAPLQPGSEEPETEYEFDAVVDEAEDAVEEIEDEAGDADDAVDDDDGDNA